MSERFLWVIENKRDDRIRNLPSNVVTMHWDWRPLVSSATEFETLAKRNFSALRSVPGDEYRLVRYTPDDQS